MPKLILSIDGVVIREFELTQERTTLGRRPHNDIVINHRAISGEHAVLYCTDGTVVLQDLDSTNGSYLNGKPVKRQALAIGDLVEIGKHQLRLMDDSSDSSDSSDGATALIPLRDPDFEGARSEPRAFASRTGAATSPSQPWPLEAAPMPAALAHAAKPTSACVQVLTGGAMGREVALTKVVTTIGKPGSAVASITRRHHGFVLAHVEGPDRTVLNGTAIGTSPLPLSSGDLIELAGTQMRFLQS